MTTPITKEQLHEYTEKKVKSLKFAITQSAFTGITEGLEKELQLAEFALAALEAEPAGWQVKKHGGNWITIKEEEVHHYKFNEELPVREIYATPPVATVDAEPVADVVAWHKEGEERTCDIRWRRFDVAPGPLFAVAQPVAVVPDDISGPLAHAYKELTPTFMRNHIAVFERYGFTPNDSSTVIQALRIALDGIERLAAMLSHSENERDMVEPVSQPYKLPDNSFTNDELEMMAHGDNPQANAYRELLAFRRGISQ